MRKDRPWHLIPVGKRRRALSTIKRSMASACDGDRETLRAAVEVLRELAPYPDEALVFDTGYGDVEPIGLPDDITPTAIESWDGQQKWFCHVDHLRPLTPAAADFLDELKAGMR